MTAGAINEKGGDNESSLESFVDKILDKKVKKWTIRIGIRLFRRCIR